MSWWVQHDPTAFCQTSWWWKDQLLNIEYRAYLTCMFQILVMGWSQQLKPSGVVWRPCVFFSCFDSDSSSTYTSWGFSSFSSPNIIVSGPKRHAQELGFRIFESGQCLHTQCLEFGALKSQRPLIEGNIAKWSQDAYHSQWWRFVMFHAKWQYQDMYNVPIKHDKTWLCICVHARVPLITTSLLRGMYFHKSPGETTPCAPLLIAKGGDPGRWVGDKGSGISGRRV